MQMQHVVVFYLQVTEFAVEESVNESILSALAAYGLEKLQGKDGNADVTQKVNMRNCHL
jgi:hypothetical protein